jgi:hypothetical protein
MEGWRQNARKRRRRALPERSSSATLFARMHFDIAGSSAVKAQDELPALGLDCAPRRPNTLAIRAIGKNSMTSQYTTLDTDRPSHGRPMHLCVQMSIREKNATIKMFRSTQSSLTWRRPVIPANPPITTLRPKMAAFTQTHVFLPL